MKSSRVRMPVLFVGHGSPMNAIEDNAWSRGFKALSGLLPRPRAILSVSAHWFVGGTFLTGAERPETIHDFGGFPRALYETQYPAPGDPALASRVSSMLPGVKALLRDDWGLDHGTWSVLRRMYPEADIPVVQLSEDERKPASWHLELAAALAPLREDGILVMGSGNLVHNLNDALSHWEEPDPKIPRWAEDFDAEVADALSKQDHVALASLPGTSLGRKAHPALDHYLPLLYAAGAAGRDCSVSFPLTGFDLGSISMRAVVFT